MTPPRQSPDWRRRSMRVPMAVDSDYGTLKPEVRRLERRIAELEGALRETVDAIEALAPVAEGHFIGTVQWDAVDRARRVLEGK